MPQQPKERKNGIVVKFYGAGEVADQIIAAGEWMKFTEEEEKVFIYPHVFYFSESGECWMHYTTLPQDDPVAVVSGIE
ncbi:MAG: hypothetical protein AAFX78_05020 [Cyanobacteria bacterium J06638_20]